MAKPDVDDSDLESAAADWFMRLERGEMNEEQRARYARWLQKSHARREAMRFLQWLGQALTAQRDTLVRRLDRIH